MREVSAFNDMNPYGFSRYDSPLNLFAPFAWVPVDQYQLQNQLAASNYQRPTPAFIAKQRRNTACQWFATKWRTRAAEIGVQGAARLMRKQGVPCDVAVSILATR